MDRKNMRIYLKGLVMLASLVAIGMAIRYAGLDEMVSERWVDEHIRGFGATGWLLFLAITAGFTAVGLPRQIVSFLGGYAFGFVSGAIAATLGTALGCALTFSYARFLGRSLVANRFGKRIRKVDDFLRDNPFTTTLIIRFMPVGSNVATNLLAGVSSVGALPFLAGSALGFIPQTLIFALLGSGIQVDTTWRVVLAVVLFALSTFWGVRLYRKNRARRIFNGDEASGA